MDTYETTIYTSVLITGILLGFIILFFVWAIIRSQRRYFEKKKQQFIEEITLLEKERDRIARDLHDELGPELAMTRLQLQRAGKVITEDKPKALLTEAEESIHNVLKRMAAIAQNLTPRALLQRGLQNMLKEYFEQWQELCPITTDFDYHVETEIKEGCSLQIFRLVQEMVHNCIKHSEASVITIRIKENKGKLYIFLNDNGKGFDPSTISGKGLGLNSLKARALLLGGTMHCETGQGTGTTYFYSFPIKTKE